MKSAFPAWLKRLDPILEVEETNGLYQAFRERRLRMGRRRTLVAIAGSFAPILPLVAVTTALMILALAGESRWVQRLTPLLALVVCCFAACVIFQRFTNRARKRTSVGMPLYIGEVFSPLAWQEQAALDLWMTGARGRDVAEAIYLETRETWLFQAILCLLGFFGVYAFFVVVLHRVIALVDLIIPTLLIAYLAVSVCVNLLLITSNSICDQIRKILRFGSATVPRGFRPIPPAILPVEQKRRGRRWRVILWTFRLLAAADVAWYIFVRPAEGMIEFTLVLLVLTVLFQMPLRAFSPEREAARCREVFEEADAPLTFWMNVGFTWDPDAKRWAFEHFGISPVSATQAEAKMLGWLGRLTRR